MVVYDAASDTKVVSPGIDAAFTVSSQRVVVDPGSVTQTPFTYGDANYTFNEYSSASSGWQISIDQPVSFDLPWFSSASPEIATVDQDGLVSPVSAGVADIHIGRQGATTKKVPLAVGTSVDTSDVTLLGFVAGSLGEHLAGNIDSLISGKTPGDAAQQFWSSLDGNLSSPNAVMNAGLFAEALDFTGVSILRSDWLSVKDSIPVTLVTSRHGIAAHHASLTQGIEVVFTDGEGSYTNAIVSNIQRIQDTDIDVVYFDRDLSVYKQYKVMPPGWQTDYSPSASTLSSTQYSDHTGWSALPVLRKSMHDLEGNWSSYLQINEVLFVGQNIASDVIVLWSTSSADAYPNDVNYRDWNSRMMPGDSGGPLFFVVEQAGEKELILATTIHSIAESPNLSGYTAEINAAMDSLAGAASGSYALQHPDLSGFTSFA